MKETAEMPFFSVFGHKNYSFSCLKMNRTIEPSLHNEPRTPTTRCASSNLQFVGSHANKKIKKRRAAREFDSSEIGENLLIYIDSELSEISH